MAGNPTSFGDMISVNGGEIYPIGTVASYAACGGYGGFTVADGYGGEPGKYIVEGVSQKSDGTTLISRSDTIASTVSVVIPTNSSTNTTNAYTTEPTKNGGAVGETGKGWGAGGGAKTPDQAHGIVYSTSHSSGVACGTWSDTKITNTVDRWVAHNYFSVTGRKVDSDGTTTLTSIYTAYGSRGGNAGALEVNIIEAQAGETIQCSVGKGGSFDYESLATTLCDALSSKYSSYKSTYGDIYTMAHYMLSSMYTFYVYTAGITSTSTSGHFPVDSAELMLQLAQPGNDGVIILQYLGE